MSPIEREWYHPTYTLPLVTKLRGGLFANITTTKFAFRTYKQQTNTNTDKNKLLRESRQKKGF